MEQFTRQQRRAAYAIERRAKKTGEWGDWETIAMPNGIPGANGWCRDIREAHRNNLYAVLVRPIKTADFGLVFHCAIRTASNAEPPWRDKQRIKDEVFGEGFTAVEVMPPKHEIVDAADMYHMFVFDRRLPFTIYEGFVAP